MVGCDVGSELDEGLDKRGARWKTERGEHGPKHGREALGTEACVGGGQQGDALGGVEDRCVGWGVGEEIREEFGGLAQADI